MKKRFLASFLTLCLTLALLPGTVSAATVASGECGKLGNNLTWTLDDVGTLTISGTGEMQEQEGDYPWEAYKANPSGSVSIVRVNIEDGVTSIGYSAFSGCQFLSEIILPNSLTSIGTSAFSECPNLESISIPNGVTSTGWGVFSGCSKLKSVSLPTKMESFGLYFGFTNCISLESISIPNGITSIDAGAFTGCSKLKKIFIPASVTSMGSGAFAGCDILSEVEFSGTKSQWMQLIEYVDGSSIPILWATVHCSDGDIVQKKMIDGVKNVPYSFQTEYLYTIGTYELVGNLPSGLSLDPETSIVSGIPRESGTWDFYVRRTIGDGEYGVLVMPRSLTILDNPDIPNKTVSLTDGVKYIPYYEKADDYEPTSSASVRYELEGTLPSGLSLNPGTAVISGVPVATGTWKFQIRRIQGDTVQEIPLSLTIQDNTDTAVQQQRNDYPILEPVGTPDPSNPNHFYKDEYTDETLIIDAPYSEFYRVIIDGQVLHEPQDYTSREGSTIITIQSQTFQKFGEGTHTIAAEFKPTNAPAGTVKRVAQNYTLNISQSSASNGSQSPQSQQKEMSFTDVTSADWFYEDVVWAYQEGLMQGVGGNRFDPKGTVSQATIVTVLARIAKIDLTSFDGETEPGFPNGQYFTTAAIWAKRAGLLPKDGTFTGNKTTTRNQMAVMLTKYLTSMGKDTTPPTQPVTFGDAAEMTQEGSDAFQTLYQYGIFKGTGGLKMEPAGSTTRAQFAALMHRIYDTAVS